MMISQGFCLSLLCLFHGVRGKDIGGSFQCHPSPWINGQLFTITLRIDRTKFPSLCTSGTLGVPYFQGSSDGETYQLNCSARDIRTACSFTPGTLGCGCTNSDDNGFYVIEYNFIAGPDHHRWWIASLTCLEQIIKQALDFTGHCNQPVIGREMGGSFQCHPSPWINGQLFTITLRIDRTKFPSLCTSTTNGEPSFEGSPDGNNFQSNCSVPDIRTGCSFTPGTLGCGCTNNDDNGSYVIEYNFIASPHHYRWWIATLLCLEQISTQALDLTGDCNQPELTTPSPTKEITTITTITTTTAATVTEAKGGAHGLNSAAVTIVSLVAAVVWLL